MKFAQALLPDVADFLFRPLVQLRPVSIALRNGLDEQSRVYSSNFTLPRVLLSEYNLSKLTAFTAILCNTVLEL